MEPQLESGSSIVKPMFKKSKKKWLYAGAAVVIVLGAGIPITIHALSSGTTVSSSMIYTVGYGNIVQSVSASGTIEPAATADLTFADSSSNVTAINVKIGQTVKKGQVLATEDDSSTKAAFLSAQAGLAQAKASLAAAQANLTKTLEGATSTQIESDQQAIQKAQLALQGAQESYKTQLAASQNTASNQQKLLSAQTQLQNDEQAASDTSGVDAAKSQLSYDQQTLANDQQNLKTLQAQYGTVTEAQVQKAWGQYQYIDSLSQKWLQGQQVGTNPYASSDAQAKSTYDTLNSEYQALQSAQQTISKDQQTIQADQRNLTNAENSLAKAKQQVTIDQQNLQLTEQQINDTSSTQQALANAKLQIQQDQISLQAAQDQLKNDQQGPDAATIDSAKASVSSAEANLQSAQDKLISAQDAEAQTKLTAPISGVVSQINGQIGQPPTAGSASGSTSASSPFIEIVDTNPNDLQVQMQISESQIGQVKAGDPVSMTVAAVPGKSFTGSVTQIYPTPTTTSNVTQYTAIATVQDPSKSLKVGMTASLTIETANKSHVVTVPAIALQQVGSREGVYVLDTSSSTGANATGNSGSSGQSGGQGGSGSGSRQGSASGGSQGSRGSGGNSGRGGFGGNTGGFSGAFTGGSLSNPAGLPKNVHFQPVQIGLFGTNEVEITSGLQAGQKILVELPAAAAASAAQSSSRQFGGGGAAGAARRLSGGGRG